jgi:glycine/D-amino acid oxidase-like deaminating enzyme
MAEHAADVGYRPAGYLWLLRPDRMQDAEASHRRYAQAGWPTEVLDPRAITARYPFIDKTDDLGGALLGVRDGLVNPNRLKQLYRDRARAAGAVFDDRVWVTGARHGASATKVQARVGVAREQVRAQLESASPDAAAGAARVYGAQRVINCAGAWSSRLARMLGYAVPSYASRRQVCVFDCREVDLSRYGMVIDPSGVYFHPEASNGMAGFAIPGEPRGVNYQYDGEVFFEERIWPVLYERATAFERLRHLTGWAGQYDVSPDESAILGEVVADGLPARRVYDAHSFSGHGVLQSFAAGRAIAELVRDGRAATIDVAELAGGRFATGQLVKETAVI